MRRVLARRGYRLERARRRDHHAVDYDHYWVWNSDNELLSIPDGRVLARVKERVRAQRLLARLGTPSTGAVTFDVLKAWVDSLD